MKKSIVNPMDYASRDFGKWEWEVDFPGHNFFWHLSNDNKCGPDCKVKGTQTDLDEATPGASCVECEADVSWLPDEASFCCFCGADLPEQES